MNNTIFLVRHGQDEDNANKILNGKRDMPLTALGREQAKITAEKLKEYNITLIYASPLKRAYETARIIADTIGIDEVVIDKHLEEREFGILTGKPLSDIPLYAKKILKTDQVDYFIEVEGAEDFPTLYERANAVLDEIDTRHEGERIVIVTHGDIGKMIRAAFHYWEWEKGLMTPYFANTEILELSPATDKKSD
jgi:broad specificity phosphatase PhoE